MKDSSGRELRRVGDFNLLPAPADCCQDCGRKHEKEQPHDATALFYKYSFYADHGRWPTWKDAVAHCTPELQLRWKEELVKIGKWTG